MTSYSKLYYENLENYKCSEIHHPWTQSCIMGTLGLGGIAFKNAAFLFFAPIYLIQLCMKGRKVSREFLKRHFYAYLQSTAFGTMYGVTFMSTSCLMRNLFGRYKFYTSVCIPAFISGLTILIEHDSRRELVIATMVNTTLEYIMRWLEAEQNMKRTPAVDTVIFMILSGFIMYLLRKYPLKKPHKMTHLWFFTPSPLKKPTDGRHKVQLKTFKIRNGSPNDYGYNYICPHIGSCWKNVLENLGKYFGIGIGLQLLRSLLPHNRQEVSLKRAFNIVLRDKRTLLFGAFLGGYVGMYKIISCMLTQFRGCDSELHSLIAGFFAGSAYYLQPNITVFLSAITTILQVFAMQATSRGFIPSTPIIGGILFAICNVLIISSRLIHPNLSPRLLVTLLSFGTNGLSDKIVRTCMEIVSRPSSEKLIRKCS